MKATILCVLTLSMAFFAGCANRQTEARGDNGKAETIGIASIQKMKLASPVVAHGTMIEKCPVAGCWFKLHDRSGTIKVDLKATKLTVVNVPLNAEVTVRGKVAPNGGEKMIQATSAAF